MSNKHKHGIVAGAPEDGGVLSISEAVLEEIAHTEAMSTEGVVPPHEGMMKGMLRRHGHRGVRLAVSGREVAFHLTFGVRHGMRIPDVASRVRERVVEAVTSKTGYAVRQVDVLVDHLATERDAPGDS